MPHAAETIVLLERLASIESYLVAMLILMVCQCAGLVVVALTCVRARK